MALNDIHMHIYSLKEQDKGKYSHHKPTVVKKRRRAKGRTKGGTEVQKKERCTERDRLFRKEAIYHCGQSPSVLQSQLLQNAHHKLGPNEAECVCMK